MQTQCIGNWCTSWLNCNISTQKYQWNKITETQNQDERIHTTKRHSVLVDLRSLSSVFFCFSSISCLALCAWIQGTLFAANYVLRTSPRIFDFINPKLSKCDQKILMSIAFDNKNFSKSSFHKIWNSR